MPGSPSIPIRILNPPDLNLTDPQPNSQIRDVSDLAKRAATGNAEAFNQLVEIHLSGVVQYLGKWFGSHHDAEDISQDVFIKAFRSIHNLRPGRSFKSWLYGIARHTAIDALRKKYREPEFESSLSSLPIEHAVHQTPESSLSAKEEYEKVWAWTRILPEKQREVLWLKYSENFSVKEIAQAMSLTQVHVKVLLHRARKTLSEQKSQLSEVIA